MATKWLTIRPVLLLAAEQPAHETPSLPPQQPALQLASNGAAGGGADVAAEGEAKGVEDTTDADAASERAAKRQKVGAEAPKVRCTFVPAAPCCS